MTIKNISKDSYHPTPVERSTKSVQEAMIDGLSDDVVVLKSVLQWRLISVTELAAPESPNGTLVSQGTAEWTINRRSVLAGIYQVKFTASFTTGDPALPQTLNALDYGFIEVVAAPVRAIIDGGSSVRWGSKEIVTVDGSLSYDADIGPGNNTGLNFTWLCLDLKKNQPVSYDCFGSFIGVDNGMTITINPGLLEIGKSCSKTDCFQRYEKLLH